MHNDDKKSDLKRINFLENENSKTMLALDEILSFDSYFSSINEETSKADLFRKTCSHLNVFTDFQSIVFQDIAEDRTFKTVYHIGAHDNTYIQKEIDIQIERRKFSEALREQKSVSSPLSDGQGYMIFHCLYSKNKIFGMFVGIHKEDILETHYTIAQLLTVLLRKTGYFLSLLQKYKRLHDEVRDLRVEVERQNSALDSAQVKASSLDEARKQLLANVSHEFRTPLNAIIGLLDLMCDSENLTEEHRDYILTASQSAESIMKIIDDLLCFVKFKSSPNSLTCCPGSIFEIIESCRQKENANAQKSGLTINVDIDEELQVLLIFDSQLLYMVFLKLLSNGIKFTKTGSISIRAEMVEENKQNIVAKFIIQDTGVGFDSNNFDFLSLPFTQEDTSTTRQFEGMGMGLAIASLLIEVMGGELICESTEDGSNFSFELSLPKA
jgi:signal transduction histidine kinase